MRRWDPLNDGQLAVLQRIAAGDHLLESASPARRSAGALRDRGLVDISKRDGWHVTLTDAGTFYLDHGCHPDHPEAPKISTAIASPTRSKPRTAPAIEIEKAANVTDRATTKRPPPHATARIARERRAAAEQLIAELLVVSTIFLKNPTDDELTERRRVVDFAKRNGLVPAGKYIEMKRKRFNLVQISLHNGQHPNTKQVNKDLLVVPTPTELRSLHPVVAALQEDRGRLAMPCKVRYRSLLFLHGLTTEAVRRGHDVREQPVPERYRYVYWSREHPGHKTYSRREGELNIIVDGFAYTVTITQESPQADAAGRWERLVVSLSYRSEGRQYNWYDRKRTTIDDHIAAVMHEVETRAAEDKQRQLIAECQKDERRVQWEAAMERARQLAIQAHYAACLDAQVLAWQRMNDIQDYCDAFERKINATADDGQAAEATQWLAWARHYAAALDPLQTLPTIPAPPELRKSDLEPYLDGWSPYGPEEPTNGRYRSRG